MVGSDKMKEKIKKIKFTKKRVIICIVVAIVIVGGAALAIKALKGTAMPAMARNVTRTVTLAKTTLADSVTVTGTVESTSVTNVSSTVSYPVSEILVKEGERVTAGQTLARLSTEDLDKQILRLRESMADNIAKAQSSYNEAIAQRDKAYSDAVGTESSVALSRNAMQQAQTAFSAAQSNIQAFQGAYDVATAAEHAAGAALNTATQNLLTSPADTALIDAQKITQDTYNAALAYTKSTAAALDSAKIACGYDGLSQASSAAAQAYEAQRKALDNLQNTYNGTVKTATASEEALASAKKNDSLTELLEKLDECEITAQASGTVTNVNAVVGSAPALNNALFVIQDTDNLKVSVSIDEYDITTVTSGMSAKIKSDATGDTEILGTVSQISQTAQVASGSMGSSSTSFGAEVSINGTGSGLLIGMNAQVEIIIYEKANVYTVPFDAIGEDENKNSVVYKRSGDEFIPIIVEKGMETDYYIEILSSELADGDIIRASANETEIAGQATDEMQFQGGMSGMTFSSDITVGGPGGNPPQGGGFSR